MKALSLFSGGKDSFMSSMIAMEQGYTIDYGITVIPEEYSMMFHYPNAYLSRFSASLLGLNIKYIMESEFENFIKNISGKYDAIITGAIASDYQKIRIEKLCYDHNTIVYSPLWRLNQEDILEELVSRNIKAKIVSISAEGFVREDLGKDIDSTYIKYLKKLYEKYKINIAGEGGEYESFVYGLSDCILKIKTQRIVWKNSGGYLILEI